MSICDLLVQANQVGRDCNAVEDIRDIQQQLLDLLCNSGLCSTTPQELAIVEECVDENYDFEAVFGDCIKDQRVVFSVCNEGNSIWYPSDDGGGGVEWKPFLLRQTGYDIGNYGIDVGLTTFVTVGGYTFPTIVGLKYDVTIGYRYAITRYGDGSGPTDDVKFSFNSSNALHLQNGVSGDPARGWILQNLRNGHEAFFNYKFIATQTSEEFILGFTAGSAEPNWQFAVRLFYLNWSAI